MNQSFFARRSFAIMLIACFLMPFLWMGTKRTIRSNRNDVRDWLPDDFQETAVHGWFQKHFPHEQFVLASWEGCTLDDPRLELLARKLVPPQKDDSAGPADALEQTKAEDAEPQYFKSVYTGRSLMDDLQARYPEMTEEQILTRLEGSLIGKDHNKTCLVVTLTEEAKGKNLRPMLEKVRRLARECNIEPPKPQAAGNPFVRAIDNTAAFFGELVFGRKVPQEGIKLGGPPVDNVAIDIEGERTLFRLAGLSLFVGLVISWLCFRSVRLTVMVFFTAILATGTGMAAVFFSGQTCDAVLLSMPSLVFVLAISASIHIVNYYHDAIREHGLDGACQRGLAHGWGPCTIAALTTALGLGSLLASHVVPISKFGVYSAVGVMATLFWVFLFLPAWLHYWPSRRYAEQHASQDDATASEARILKFWRRVGGLVIRHNGWVAAGCLVVMVFFAVGVARVKTSIKLMKLFSADAEIIAHYGWLEHHIGPLVPMEVVIRVDNRNCRLSFVERMRLAQAVEEAVESLDEVGGALSAATFAPDIQPDGSQGGVLERIGGFDRRRLRDKILSKRLAKYRKQFREYLTVDTDVALADEALDPTLEELGITGPVTQTLRARKLVTLRAIESYGRDDSPRGPGKPLQERLTSIRGISPGEAGEIAARLDAWRTAHGEELWRVSARVEALSDLDYGYFVDRLVEVVEPVLDSYRETGVQGIEATYTGMVPLVYKTQHELMRGLFESLALAFVLIAFVMMIVLRSPTAGLLSMLPNLFPVVVIFGILGWTRILVDIGSMMTASVALGVAVDDTIHYLTWFRKGLDAGRDRKAAAMLAYERCGTAMTQTTVIGGLGLAVFAFSTFTPTQRFGMLMLMLLFAALIGDLVFLPAVLCGPAGRFFRTSKKARRRRPPQGDQPAEPASDQVVALPIGEVSAPSTVRHARTHRSHNAL